MGKNKSGKIVSKKRSLAGKKNSWIVACNKARAALKIKGFTVIKGHPALQEGEGVPGLRTTCVSFLGGRGACSGLRELPAACLSDGRGRRRSVRTRFGPEMSCTPMESL